MYLFTSTHLVQRSFPLTEEEYLLRLDDVANTLKCWGAVSHIRNSLAKLKERPRIGKVNFRSCMYLGKMHVLQIVFFFPKFFFSYLRIITCYLPSDKEPNWIYYNMIIDFFSTVFYLVTIEIEAAN